MHSVNFPYAIQEITMLNNAIKLARLGTRDLKSQRQNIKLSSLRVRVGLVFNYMDQFHPSISCPPLLRSGPNMKVV